MATTTLRIDGGLYRETKAAAARQGTTVTRFIEDALRLKLRLGGALRRPEEIELPTFAAGKGFPFPPKALKRLAQRSEREHDASRSRARDRGLQKSREKSLARNTRTTF